jgi:hypothetical protein
VAALAERIVVADFGQRVRLNTSSPGQSLPADWQAQWQCLQPRLWKHQQPGTREQLEASPSPYDLPEAMETVGSAANATWQTRSTHANAESSEESILKDLLFAAPD